MVNHRPARARLIAAAAAAVLLSGGAKAVAQLPGGNWGLRFADEFNEPGLDADKWNVAYPWGRVHNYPAYITDDNVNVNNGALSLTAKRGWTNGQPFSSGAVNTQGLLDFHTGYIEARMKLPSFLGAWPAFWALQDGWPPELDVMEARFRSDNTNGNYNTGYGDMYQYVGTYHYGADYTQEKSAGTGFVSPGPNLTDDFHNYGTLWESDHVTFYFDGRQMGSVWSSQADIAQMKKMYLLLNLGVGGWPGDPPSWADVTVPFQTDFVRVWQHPGAARTDWTPSGDGYKQWDDEANWTAGSAQLNTQTAYMGNANASGQQVDWNGTKSLAHLVFQSHVDYQIAYPDDQLMLSTLDGTNASIEVQYDPTQTHQGVQTVGARVQLAGDVSVKNANAAPLTFSGEIHGPGQLGLESGKTVFNANVYNTGGVKLTGSADATFNAALNSYNNPILVGAAAGSNSTLRLGAKSSLNAPNLTAGDSGGTGAVVQGGGSVNLSTGELWIGQATGSTGSYTLNGGGLTANNWVAVGRSGGAGTLNVTGGVIAKKGAGNLILGSLGGRGVVNQSGGLVDVQSGDTLLGEDSGGSGVYTITGGTANLHNVVLSSRGGGGGTFNLNGGVVNAVAVKRVGTGTAALNFNGGTLRPTASNAAFLQGLTAATVGPAGGTIDTNAFNVAVAQPFTGTGGLTKTGGGTLTLSGNSSNTGRTNLAAGGLVLTGTLGGGLDVAAGTSFSGTGRVNGAVTSRGKIEPGVNGVGRLSAGSLALAGTSAITAQVRGVGSNYDQIAVGGTASLGGSLAINWENGFRPQPNQTFDLLTYGGRTGVFSSINTGLTDLPVGMTLDAIYGPASFTLRGRALLDGDATLDGRVDGADFAALLADFGKTGQLWSGGDFDADGRVNRADFAVLLSHFGQSMPGVANAASASDFARVRSFAAELGVTAVPEPTGLAVPALAGLALLKRRRR